MLADARPAAVRRWAWRPLWLLAVGVVAIVWSLVLDHETEGYIHHEYAGRPHVIATPTGDWDGSWYLTVTYAHRSGQVVRASTYVGHSALIPEPDQSVEVQVSRNNPTHVRLVGDTYRPTWWIWYLLYLAPGLLLLARRRIWLRRTEHRAGDLVTPERKNAVPSAPSWWSWTWRLHLYSQDGPADGKPVVSVPLIAPPGELGLRPVDVVGSPRRWRRVAVRDRVTGELLWPARRTRLTVGIGPRRTAPGQPVPHSVAARVLLGIGLVVFLGGAIADAATEDYDVVAGRAYRMEATLTHVTVDVDAEDTRETVADVHYTWLGQPIDARITSDRAVGVAVGQPVRVDIDPVQPHRAWFHGDDPPVGGDWPVGVWMLGGAVMLAALIVHLVARGRSQATPRLLVPPPPPHLPSGPLLPPPPPPPGW